MWNVLAVIGGITVAAVVILFAVAGVLACRGLPDPPDLGLR